MLPPRVWDRYICPFDQGVKLLLLEYRENQACSMGKFVDATIHNNLVLLLSPLSFVIDTWCRVVCLCVCVFSTPFAPLHVRSQSKWIITKRI